MPRGPKKIPEDTRTQEVLKLVNRVRVKHGVKPVVTLKKGYRCNSSECPISSTLITEGMKTGTYFMDKVYTDVRVTNKETVFYVAPGQNPEELYEKIAPCYKSSESYIDYDQSRGCQSEGSIAAIRVKHPKYVAKWVELFDDHTDKYGHFDIENRNRGLAAP